MVEIQLPGQAMEKAAGDVASAAGLSLVDAMGRRLKAWSARRSARDEGLAEEEKAEIAYEGERKREQQRQEDRRLEEHRELVHQAEMSLAYARAKQRVSEQIEDDQHRIEWIGVRSLQIADSDPDRSDAREIKDDWLKRFFRYAAEVDESALLEILARGLADAAINNRNLLSPKALDVLRHFELHSFEMFKFCAAEISRFEALPADMIENRAVKCGSDLDLALMIELGLVRDDRRKHFSLRLGDVFLTFSYDSGVNSEFRVIQLTFVGRSIAALIDARIRKLEVALRELSINKEVRVLQEELGLEKVVVTSFARALIGHIADTGQIDVQARDLRDKNQRTIISTSRKKKSDPFVLSKIKEYGFGDNYTKMLVTAFVEVFDDFDTNELPNMYTTEVEDDQSD